MSCDGDCDNCKEDICLEEGASPEEENKINKVLVNKLYNRTKEKESLIYIR